jgi:hypothetical protein
LASVAGVDQFIFHYPPEMMEDKGFLHDRLRSVNIARRMNWAALRCIARMEDAAYFLMGIFNINILLLYGEGLEKALIRL